MARVLIILALMAAVATAGCGSVGEECAQVEYLVTQLGQLYDEGRFRLYHDVATKDYYAQDPEGGESTESLGRVVLDPFYGRYGLRLFEGDEREGVMVGALKVGERLTFQDVAVGGVRVMDLTFLVRDAGYAEGYRGYRLERQPRYGWPGELLRLDVLLPRCN